MTLNLRPQRSIAVLEHIFTSLSRKRFTLETESTAMNKTNAFPGFSRRPPSIHLFFRMRLSFYSSYIIFYAVLTIFMINALQGWASSVVLAAKYFMLVRIFLAAYRMSSLKLWPLHLSIYKLHSRLCSIKRPVNYQIHNEGGSLYSSS